MKMRPSMLGSSTSCCSTCSRISLCRLLEWLIFCSPTRTYTPLLWNLPQGGRHPKLPGKSCWLLLSDLVPSLALLVPACEFARLLLTCLVEV